jgi:hypothetical protein
MLSPELLVPSWLIRKGGLSNFVPTRYFYNARASGGTITSYINTVTRRLVLISVTLVTSRDFEGILETIRHLVRKNVEVKISLLNPDKQDLMSSMCGIFDKTPNQLAGDIRESLHKLNTLKIELVSAGINLFSLRVHNSVPSGSVIMLDCNCENEHLAGRMQIETKPYKGHMNSSFAYELTDYPGNEMFANLLNGYNKLMDDGHEYYEAGETNGKN